MMYTVVKDMSYFLLVLLITIIALADSMYMLSLANKGDGRYLSNFFESLLKQYLSAVGEFYLFEVNEPIEKSEFRNITWFIFALGALLNCIVMLNLLIAIVSQTF